MATHAQAKRRRFGRPLFLLAGLPEPVHESVQKALKSDRSLPQAEYLAVPFPQNDTYSSGAATRLLKLAGQRVAIEMRSDSLWITPGKIILLFVRAPGDDILRRNFGFFAYPVGVEVSYRERKHTPMVHGVRNPGFALSRVRAAVATILGGEDRDLEFLEKQISFKYNKTSLLLPAKNFIEPKRRRPLSVLLEELWTSQISWQHRALESSQFVREDFPKSPSNKNRFAAYSDDRELVFVPALSRHWHAPPRPLTNDDSADALRTKLNELYRFGVPIHEGFHYDAQRRGNEPLAKIEFLCALNGTVRTRKGYINIYPNDCVRK